MPSSKLHRLTGHSRRRSSGRRGRSRSSFPGSGFSEAPVTLAPQPVFRHRDPHPTPENLRQAHAAGQITGAALADGLARATGTPRVHFELTRPAPDVADILDPDFSLRHQCLPWRREGETLWIATARPDHFGQTAELINKHLGPQAPRIRPVVAPRDDIQTWIARHHRITLSERMRSRPPLHLSCRAWKAESRGRALLFFTALCALLFAFSAAPEQVMTLLIYLALATMVVASTLKTAAALARLTDRTPPPKPRKPPAPATLPRVSVLVPLFREDRIATTLLRRLKKLTYPRDRLEILLVLEETDQLTRDTLDVTPLPPWIRTVIVPDGAPRTKPRAMNYALDFCEGDIIGVYDAEDAPDPDQLLRIAERFAKAPEDVVCLQGVLDYYNPRASWIARCFTIEYNIWFRLILPGMARLGFALPLGGTTLFVKRDRLEEIGAWDAHNVTEDADLGFRLARSGYRTLTFDSTTGEEANHRPVPWIRQRSRWLKGYLATYCVHMRTPFRLWRDLGTWRFLGFQAHFVTALTQFTLAPLLWIFWMVSFGFDLPYTTVDADPRVHILVIAFLGQEVLTMILGVIATRRAGHRKLWRWVPLMHLYWPLGAVAMWKALHELIFRPFYWDKTDHGHSLPDVGSVDRTNRPGIELQPRHEGPRNMLAQPLTRRDLVPRLDGRNDGVML